MAAIEGHAAVLRLFGGLPNGKELLQEGVQCCQRHCMGSGETLLLETLVLLSAGNALDVSEK